MCGFRIAIVVGTWVTLYSRRLRLPIAAAGLISS
jgi:hypothetical protein